MFVFDNSYARLPTRFYTRLAPIKVSAPQLIRVNALLSRELGVDPDWLASTEGVAVLSGNLVPQSADPLAMAYAGHQFGHFVPQLGDGRAILLGELRARDGLRYDIHLKGSGRTPFSRNGDGRAAIGPVLREYIVSEAMHALGIPTTRTLAAVTTGEHILREAGSLPGAVLARVARSHVRIGTFEYFAARGDTAAVRVLADYIVERLYPQAALAANPMLALLESVVARTAELIAFWQCVGFIHGVMNTDNTSIAGETLDYGPCAFMDSYDPSTVFSSIDHHGRYAFDQQPRIARWNLTRLAEALLPLLGEGEASVAAAQKALDAFPAHFETAYAKGLRAKFGFAESYELDLPLIQEFFGLMAESRADFTLTFRRLCDSAEGNDAPLNAQLRDQVALERWLARWRERLSREGDTSPASRAASMRAVNPVYIPRNHRIEAAIVAAQDDGDFTHFEELLEVTATPFEYRPKFARYAEPPEPDEIVRQTFCGT
jgi:uncharacterized protein YdiU (UPF0061 family)